MNEPKPSAVDAIGRLRARMMPQVQTPAVAAPKFSLPIPGLVHELKLGDAIAQLTKAVGISPCGGCQGRQEQLNRLLAFEPKEPR